ncbi:hypothetical protein FNU76_20175 [Chitinimonas arctica]|uniref:PPM-type phosphatase domain-containing protein n=1 Tax=Chitinimonas arctica TaxID=2594795 RepID=A0A516SK03_9NEIS|nr:hypothetical protein [Chitinimonas arctica]QDQ28487.1 hypothetical protein FNU76_20175 [Chitinimonas arctica]
MHTTILCQNYNSVSTTLYENMADLLEQGESYILHLEDENREYLIQKADNGSFSSTRYLENESSIRKSKAGNFFAGVYDFFSRGFSGNTCAHKLAHRFDTLKDANTLKDAKQVVDACLGDAQKKRDRKPPEWLIRIEASAAVPLVTNDNQSSTPGFAEKFQTGTLATSIHYTTGSTFRNPKPDASQAARKTHSADCVLGGKNKNNYPMAVILDGCGVTAQHAEVEYIGTFAMIILNHVIQFCEGKNRTPAEIKQLVVEPAFERVNALLEGAIASTASFSAVGFYNQAAKKGEAPEIHAVGFGTGDTIAIIQGERTKTLLEAKNLCIYDEKTLQPVFRPLPFPATRDAFSGLKRGEEKLSLAVVAKELLSFNDIKMEEGDLKLTLATDGLFTKEHPERSTKKNGSTLVTTHKQIPLPENANFSTSKAAEFADNLTNEQFLRNRKAEVMECVGDDLTVLSIDIPK